jgi:DNA mismatch repair protein MutL
MTLPEVAPTVTPMERTIPPLQDVPHSSESISPPAPQSLDAPLSTPPKQELTPSWMSQWSDKVNPLSIQPAPANSSVEPQSPPVDPYAMRPSEEHLSINKPLESHSPITSPASIQPKPVERQSLSSLAPHGVPTRPAFFRAMRFSGQMKATYLVMEAPTGLMMIDQHAAHERVTYERLKVAYQHREIPRQRLLFPATVELSPSEVALTESFADELMSLGLEVQLFGPTTIAVVEVPLLLAKGDPEKLLKGALDEFAKRDTSVSLDDKRSHLLATMACHSSVRAGQQLSGDEVRSLVASMDETDNIGHCPHGRPVYLEMNWKELEKRFGRLGNFLP